MSETAPKSPESKQQTFLSLFEGLYTNEDFDAVNETEAKARRELFVTSLEQCDNSLPRLDDLVPHVILPMRRIVTRLGVAIPPQTRAALALKLTGLRNACLESVHTHRNELIKCARNAETHTHLLEIALELSTAGNELAHIISSLKEIEHAEGKKMLDAVFDLANNMGDMMKATVHRG